MVRDTLGVVPGHRRLWVTARRALVYQLRPERLRSIHLGTARGPETPVTTIAAELPAEAPAVPILPPAPPEEMPLPWQTVRAMHPLTEIIEALPLCAST